MKKKTSFDKAILDYNEFFGKAPTEIEITNAYHEYAKNWKHYDGFIDWIINSL